MTNLATFQSRFTSLILARPETLANLSETDKTLFQDNGIPIHEGLQVYHANVLGNLTQIILYNYPLLTTLLGEDTAQTIAKDYTMTNPPSTACLTLYGQNYPQFLQSFPPLSQYNLPFIPQVAALEAAITRATHAKDDAALTPYILSEVSHDKLETLKLPLRQSATLIKSDYDLTAIKALCNHNDNDNTAQQDLSPLQTTGTFFTRVHRPDLEPVITPLTEAEYSFLSALNKGTPLGEATQTALNNHPTFNLQNILSKHLTLQSIACN